VESAPWCAVLWLSRKRKHYGWMRVVVVHADMCHMHADMCHMHADMCHMHADMCHMHRPMCSQTVGVWVSERVAAGPCQARGVGGIAGEKL
jgi:hypothetical protein